MKTIIDNSDHIYFFSHCLPPLVLLVSIGCYFLKPTACPHYFLIFLTDVYLILMLWTAAACSRINANKEIDINPGEKIAYPYLAKYIFPKRTVGLFTFSSIFFILVFGFAGIYLYRFPCGFNEIFLTQSDYSYALYISFQTMGLNDFHPLSPDLRWIVMSQLFSTILFLTALFPLYISRLTELDEYKWVE